MNIHFSSRAISEIDLLSELVGEKTGFVFGMELGKNLIIKNILQLNFNESSVVQVYNTVYQKKGHSLLGVFFMNKKFFLSDCFVENIILIVQDGQQKVFRYGFDDGCAEKRCDLVYLS